MRPAKTLEGAFNACDPTRPLEADDDRYVDLAIGRGSDGDAVQQCGLQILWSERPLVQLFAGHRGCGKSTELRRLQKDLESKGYFVAYIDAETDLDLEDTEPTDILLSLIRGLDAALRDAEIEVSEKLLADFGDWFAEVVEESTHKRALEAELRTEAELSANLLFAKLLSKLTGQIKTGVESKKLIRQRLDPQLSQLLSRGRRFVEEARLQIQKKKGKDLVLIVDSLDRIALKELKDGRTSHEVLFIERGNLLKEMGCHLVVTVPLSLLHSAKASHLATIFPDHYILPMVKIAERGTRTPWRPGQELLKELLRQRLVLEEVLEKAALDRLIHASGGHPRFLMILVRYALTAAGRLPVPFDAAEKAVQRLVRDFDRSIPDEHWPLLVQVHRNQTAKNDADHQLMLFSLSVLEYQNTERWCDVHPAVRETRAFREAVQKAEEAPDDGASRDSASRDGV
ncbi:MAG TPA: hypothetical protein DD490_35005 [Acidobacteria bacterium]|nr:hypothetical protein [Acidobacteriota bacterium]